MISPTGTEPKSDKDPVLFSVKRIDDVSAELDLLVPGALSYFRGHFPGYPILAGVVQIDWAIRYGRAHLNVADRPAEVVQAKFRKPIKPGTRLRLRLDYALPSGRLSFSYRDDEGPCSSGQITLAAV